MEGGGQGSSRGCDNRVPLSLALKPKIFGSFNKHVRMYTYVRRFDCPNHLLKYFLAKNKHPPVLRGQLHRKTGKEKRSTGKRECVRDMLAINPPRGGIMVQERRDADTDTSCSIMSQPRSDLFYSGC